MDDNYSALEKLLHRLTLGSKIVREVSFDLEKLLFGRKAEALSPEHVFICGMARSGTTILLNSLHQTNQFASLTYADMPFVLAPNLWGKISFFKTHKEKKERAHADGILISSDSPEAFEEVFWRTLSAEDFPSYLELICKKNKKSRYLSKNNQNVNQLDRILDLFPKAEIVIPFRNPLQSSASLLKQHQMFSKAQGENTFIRDYMKLIGHSEFGLDYTPIINQNFSYKDFSSINHWLEQWLLLHQNLTRYLQSKNVNFVCYEDLCSDENVWTALQKKLSIENLSGAEFSLAREYQKPNNLEAPLLKNALELYENLKANSIRQ